MSFPSGRLSQEARQQLRHDLDLSEDGFIRQLPKVELHVHIEGTLTPTLRWKLARRKGFNPRFGRHPLPVKSFADLEQGYRDIISSAQLCFHPRVSEAPATFFEAYYSGFEVLRTKEDFFDLAMHYFEYAASVNVRYCEVFFDPQGHTSRGVTWGDMMRGFQAAQEKAKLLNVQVQWIMCFLRDQSIESAMDHYKAALEYKHMIVGIGLDSNEHHRPPSLFDEVYSVAQGDGFRITAHCDVGVENTHEHIRQVVTTLGGSGAQRIDHGLNAADRQDLLDLIVARDVSMTICPWAYLRRETYESIADRLRVLVTAGIKICVASDSPAYMDDSWVLPNLLLAQKMSGFNKHGLVDMMKDSIEMSWATAETKKSIANEIDQYLRRWK